MPQARGERLWLCYKLTKYDRIGRPEKKNKKRKIEMGNYLICMENDKGSPPANVSHYPSCIYSSLYWLHRRFLFRTQNKSNVHFIIYRVIVSDPGIVRVHGRLGTRSKWPQNEPVLWVRKFLINPMARATVDVLEPHIFMARMIPVY